mmetsp:Transcript_50628/g.118814  ORF Transcript_50628/g.118814 Transcript_50628/m.118814 type:complete len:123 (-) Transcript_50628:2170-2538(-)
MEGTLFGPSMAVESAPCLFQLLRQTLEDFSGVCILLSSVGRCSSDQFAAAWSKLRPGDSELLAGSWLAQAVSVRRSRMRPLQGPLVRRGQLGLLRSSERLEYMISGSDRAAYFGTCSGTGDK